MPPHLPGLLTPQQFLLLSLLSARFGLRYEEIALALYGKNVPAGAKNTITVQIHNMRKALEPYSIDIVTYERLGAHGYRYAIPMRCRPLVADLLRRGVLQPSSSPSLPDGRSNSSRSKTRPNPRRR